ncbi:MAG: hypothetical protein BGP13_22785 [Sphingobacteriales bacterium 40-81]|nr:MAG: hypothetical protein BGP13_22785 [Sphingobacteriales bacterium 40-81]
MNTENVIMIGILARLIANLDKHKGTHTSAVQKKGAFSRGNLFFLVVSVIIGFFSYFIFRLIVGNFWHVRNTDINYLEPLLIITGISLVVYSVVYIFRLRFLKYRQQAKRNIRTLKKQKSVIEVQKKELEQKNEILEARLKRLSELNRSRIVMFSALSHDFKDNIYCLHRCLEIVERSENGHVFFEETLPLLKENSVNTIKLLESVLNWGKTLLHFTQPVFTIVDLNHLLNVVISFKSKMAEEKKINMRIEAEGDLFATADGNMIEIVLRNILANAIKFSNPGYPISIFAEKKNNSIHISVIDYGVGMDKSKITMLLKGKTFTTPGTFNEKGTGIGLLLSKELLERNAGTLAIASKIGMGTKIEIILPAYQMSNN